MTSKLANVTFLFCEGSTSRSMPSILKESLSVRGLKSRRDMVKFFSGIMYDFSSPSMIKPEMSEKTAGRHKASIAKISKIFMLFLPRYQMVCNCYNATYKVIRHILLRVQLVKVACTYEKHPLPLTQNQGSCKLIKLMHRRKAKDKQYRC